jgi:hypothetical protein
MRSIHKRFVLFAIAALVAALAIPAGATPETPPMTVDSAQYLGQVVFPPDAMFDGTQIGGLSSITYDAGRDVYYSLSDDQAAINYVRYYTTDIDYSDGTLDPGDVTFTKVTQLYESKKQPFGLGGLDPEGFVLDREGFFYMSSEGNILSDPILDPFIRRYNRNGRVTASLPIPSYYLPNGVDRGVRFNLSFESLNLTPDSRYLVTAGEGALFQDGPASSYTNGSLARILIYDNAKRKPVAEYVYEVGPWAEPSAIFGVNGIAEVLPIDNNGTMLVMERSFSVNGTLGGGTGNSIKIYEISTAGATDVLGVPALYDGGSPISFTSVSKRLVFDFDSLGIPIDNIEGMTFGPDLPDGRCALIVVSDDNFGPGQFTQFALLGLDIRPAD